MSEKESVIDTKKRVTVYATEKSVFHKPGKEIVCSIKVAERLIENGKATAGPVKVDKKK